MSIFSGAIDYFVRGGLCMWPLLICSVIAIVIGVERYLYFKQAMSGTKFVNTFCGILDNADINAASSYAKESKGQAANMAVEILELEGHLESHLESIIYAKADRIIDGLEKYTNYLSVIVGLAPMIGLLGTIVGMISSFNALNERAQNPMAVTAGIGEALITTVFGLCVAIMTMCIHAYLSGKIKTESLNIYEIAGTLTDIIQLKNCGIHNHHLGKGEQDV